MIALLIDWQQLLLSWGAGECQGPASSPQGFARLLPATAYSVPGPGAMWQAGGPLLFCNLEQVIDPLRPSTGGKHRCKSNNHAI